MAHARSPQVIYDPAAVGLDNVSIAAATDSNWLPCFGHNTMTVRGQTTSVGGGAVTFKIAYARDRAGDFSTTEQIGTNAAGTVTYADVAHTLTVAAGSDSFHLHIPVNGTHVRIEDLDGPADTSATVEVIFGSLT
jgi:hypothetical protein